MGHRYAHVWNLTYAHGSLLHNDIGLLPSVKARLPLPRSSHDWCAILSCEYWICVRFGFVWHGHIRWPHSIVRSYQMCGRIRLHSPASVYSLIPANSMSTLSRRCDILTCECLSDGGFGLARSSNISWPHTQRPDRRERTLDVNSFRLDRDHCKFPPTR